MARETTIDMFLEEIDDFKSVVSRWKELDLDTVTDSQWTEIYSSLCFSVDLIRKDGQTLIRIDYADGDNDFTTVPLNDAIRFLVEHTEAPMTYFNAIADDMEDAAKRIRSPNHGFNEPPTTSQDGAETPVKVGGSRAK